MCISLEIERLQDLAAKALSDLEESLDAIQEEFADIADTSDVIIIST